VLFGSLFGSAASFSTTLRGSGGIRYGALPPYSLKPRRRFA
jgi:hypothetical protein